MNSERKEFKATGVMEVIFYLLAYGWIGFYFYMYLFNNVNLIHNVGTFMGYSILLLITFFLSSLMSNYYIIEKNILTIKNYIAFWKNSTYDLQRLYSIEYLYVTRIGFSFMLKVKNSKSSMQCINGLSKETIIELYHIFKQYNIKLTGFTTIDKELI